VSSDSQEMMSWRLHQIFPLQNGSGSHWILSFRKGHHLCITKPEAVALSLTRSVIRNVFMISRNWFQPWLKLVLWLSHIIYKMLLKRVLFEQSSSHEGYYGDRIQNCRKTKECWQGEQVTADLCYNTVRVHLTNENIRW
jgi:hypothetical protein